MPVIINGTTGISGVDGSAASPAIEGSDTNTGMFFPAADTIAFATNGGEELRIGPAGQIGIAGANYGTSGQVFTSAGSAASPSWAEPQSMILLGTLTTTSGASQSLTGLTLTSYKQITLVFVGVSHNDAGNQTYLVGTSTADDVAVSTTFGNTATVNGFVFIALSSGTYSSALSNSNNAATVLTGTTPLRTSSTSISVAPLAGSFDAGSILVYGIQ